MYYIEFIDEQDRVITRGMMSSLPKQGDFVYEGELYKVHSITFMSNNNVLEEWDGAIFVRVEVDPLKRAPMSKWEGRIFKIILLMWLILFGFIFHTIYQKLHYTPSEPLLIPGVGKVVKPPIMLQPPYHAPPQDEEEPEPPKSKGMRI